VKNFFVKSKIKILLFSFVLILLLSIYFNYVVRAKDYNFPVKQGWLTASPEEEGVDSKILASVIDDLTVNNVHSFIFIRNGHIITEGYNADNDKSTKQDILSITKSITSSLIGIAIKDHKIKDENVNIGSYFPQLSQDTEPLKKEIKISNLLTMTSNLEWNNDNEISTLSMIHSSDWIEHLLQLPLNGNPGTQFMYSNGNPHLLSAILQKATGQSEASYAKEVLFNPLGITDVEWESDPNGNSIGSYGIHMTIRDLAKYGYLYLNNGVWDKERIIPKEWITKSTHQFVTFNESSSHPYEQGYGYLWWLHKNSQKPEEQIFSANGSSGQSLVIMPKQNMILVVTANNKDSFFMDPIIDNTLMNSIKSDQSIKPNPEGVSFLNSKIQLLKQIHDK
jgi:CubicO group peptidase (beta-lactamase class C family)